MFYLKRNLPTTERLIRASLGLCAGVATATLASTTWAMIAGYASAVALAARPLSAFVRPVLFLEECH
jgi:hypothetical protein